MRQSPERNRSYIQMDAMQQSMMERSLLRISQLGESMQSGNKSSKSPFLETPVRMDNQGLIHVKDDFRKTLRVGAKSQARP